MKPWDTFYPDVLPYVDPLSPNPMVDRHLLRSVQKFCDTTQAWRMDLDPVVLSAGVRDYEIELEPFTELVRIESATLNGERISVWRSEANVIGQGRYIGTPDGRALTVSWTPSGPMSLVLNISARPSDSAKGVDDILAAKYSKVIADGAVASLNKDRVALSDFDGECSTIAARIWRGNSSARPRAKAMFF